MFSSKTTNNMVMMTKDGFSKILNFITTGSVAVMHGCGHITHTVKRHISLRTKSAFLTGTRCRVSDNNNTIKVHYLLV